MGMASNGAGRAMQSYEQRIDADRAWGFHDACLHFENASEVHKTLGKVTRRLADLGIPYAVAGAMAMFFHGYRRFTMDVDILVTPDGMERFRHETDSGEFCPLADSRRSFLDVQSGVQIDFIRSGDPAGSGDFVPFAIPDPLEARTTIEGVRCMQLARLIDLKLAFGMAHPGRLRHLADVQEMIPALNLSETFGEQLHPAVWSTYYELWQAVYSNPP
jgi:hypothetical protein